MQEELLKRINPLVVIDMNKKDSESTKKKKKEKEEKWQRLRRERESCAVPLFNKVVGNGRRVECTNAVQWGHFRLKSGRSAKARQLIRLYLPEASLAAEPHFPLVYFVPFAANQPAYRSTGFFSGAFFLAPPLIPVEAQLHSINRNAFHGGGKKKKRRKNERGKR